MFEAFSQVDSRQAVELCVINRHRRRPVQVEYVYYENIAASHRICFRKKRRAVFELFLGPGGQWLETVLKNGRDLVSTDFQSPRDDQPSPGVAVSLLSFLLGGKRRRCLVCQPDHTASFDGGSLRRRYWFVLCCRGAGQRVIIFQTKISRGASPHRKGQTFSYNWVRMSVEDFRRLLNAAEDTLLKKR